ncbi:MAG TPA: hypothetical protein VNN74_05810 [Candidatus Micrarchaeia archaeon]|nr:hypothetical protein [Candidatus Micrarchaeia archaeon]
MSPAFGRRTLGAATMLLCLAGAPNVLAATRAPARSAARTDATSVAVAPAPRLSGRPRPLAIGTVVSVSATGGLFNRGVLQLKRPNGRAVLISLTPYTKAFQFRGRGAQVHRIPVSALLPGDVVVVRGRSIPHRGPVAVLIYDTSFNGGVNPAAGAPG